LEIHTEFENKEQLIQALNEDKLDLAVGHLKKDLQEALEISYSRSYLKLNYALITNRLKIAQLHIPDLEIETLRKSLRLSLKDKVITIGLLSENRVIELVTRSFSKARIKTYDNRLQLLDSLLKGECDAIFGDEAELTEYFKNRPTIGLYLQYWALPELQDELVIYLSWKNEKLKNWLNIFLEQKTKHLNFYTLCNTRYE
jgi:ABC-type amino acid transport substrate-binding protein